MGEKKPALKILQPTTPQNLLQGLQMIKQTMKNPITKFFITNQEAKGLKLRPIFVFLPKDFDILWTLPWM